VRDLPDLPLLDIDWVAPDWVTWEQALLQANTSARSLSTRRFGKFSLALQAASAGQGLVLGWHRMVAPMLDRGELVRLTDMVLPAPGTYWLTWS
jgi:DNA-binding transcriptional LysR family regulator